MLEQYAQLIASPPGRKHRDGWSRSGWRKVPREKGPLALLLMTLHQHGACLDQQWNIKAQGEPDINILHTPAQILKPTATAFAARMRTRTLANTRRDNQGTTELHPTRSRGHLNTEGGDANILLMLQCGAEWTKDYVCKLGEASDKLCTACGGVHSLEHVLCHCPHHQETRMKHAPSIAALDPRSLPTAILRGLAPPMKGSTLTTFWGQKGTDFPEPNRAPVGGERENEVPAYIDNIMARWSETGTFRQLLANIRGDSKIDPQALPLPAPCPHLPPHLPATYTDGGVINTADPAMSLAGVGIWHLKRLTRDLTQMEKAVCKTAAKGEGLELWGQLEGHANSSTRAEVAAALIALQASTPVHIATDKQAFLQKANRLQHIAINTIQDHLLNEKTWEQATTATANTNPLRKIWNRTKDGDLWEAYWRAIIAKGPHSVRLTKVKAHATQRQLDEGSMNLKKGGMRYTIPTQTGLVARPATAYIAPPKVAHGRSLTTLKVEWVTSSAPAAPTKEGIFGGFTPCQPRKLLAPITKRGEGTWINAAL